MSVLRTVHYEVDGVRKTDHYVERDEDPYIYFTPGALESLLGTVNEPFVGANFHIRDYKFKIIDYDLLTDVWACELVTE